MTDTDLFKSSDLAAAVESLQVTYGNIVTDLPDVEDDSVGIIITERLWNAARDRNFVQIGYCLGVVAFWAQLKGVDSPSLEMRMKEVRNAAR